MKMPPRKQATTVFSEHPLVVLGIGSNRGDSRRIVFDALDALEHVLMELRRASLYQTEPLYVTNQERFINTAAAGFYNGSPAGLLSSIHEIEVRFGRDRAREQRWGERTLDIDILLFGSLAAVFPPAADGHGLEIPHPRLAGRRFALEPLLELLPDATEPGTGRAYRTLCEALPPQGCMRINSA